MLTTFGPVMLRMSKPSSLPAWQASTICRRVSEKQEVF
jgi:hypothetical protein